MFVCMSVYVYVDVYVHVYVYVINVCICMFMYACTYVRMHVCMYMCMYVFVCVCMCMYVHVCVSMHVCMHGWMDGWMYVFTYIHRAQNAPFIAATHQSSSMRGRRSGGTRSILADVGDSGPCGERMIFHNTSHRSTPHLHLSIFKRTIPRVGPTS